MSVYQKEQNNRLAAPKHTVDKTDLKQKVSSAYLKQCGLTISSKHKLWDEAQPMHKLSANHLAAIDEMPDYVDEPGSRFKDGRMNSLGAEPLHKMYNSAAALDYGMRGANI